MQIKIKNLTHHHVYNYTLYMNTTHKFTVLLLPLCYIPSLFMQLCSLVSSSKTLC